MPLKLVPLRLPVEATEDGVMAPSVMVIAGVVVGVATVPLTPLAVVTDVLVTVPLPLPDALSVLPVIDRFVPTISSETEVPLGVDPSSLLFALSVASFAKVTALFAMVAANDPVPVPVTSPVKAIVWSPVLVPLKLVPLKAPVDATEEGVMAPSVRLIAGVVVGFATVPLTPFAVVTEALVTVPPVLVALSVLPVIERFVPTISSETDVPLGVDPSSLLFVLSVASFANVTALFAIVAANDPVPVPVTSPVKLIVWSPVLVPLKLVPLKAPVEATEDGVMAPSAMVIAGVVVGFATVPLTPFAVVTDVLVTVPPLPAALRVLPVIERFVPSISSETEVPLGVDPSNLLYVLSVASLDSVTALFAIVAANDPVPVPVTSPVRLIVWSPVFVPDEVPVCVPLRLDPVTVPDAATEVGVMAPKAIVMAGEVVGFATVPLTPFAVLTDTLLTVPAPRVVR